MPGKHYHHQGEHQNTHNTLLQNILNSQQGTSIWLLNTENMVDTFLFLVKIFEIFCARGGGLKLLNPWKLVGRLYNRNIFVGHLATLSTPTTPTAWLARHYMSCASIAPGRDLAKFIWYSSPGRPWEKSIQIQYKNAVFLSSSRFHQPLLIVLFWARKAPDGGRGRRINDDHYLQF